MGQSPVSVNVMARWGAARGIAGQATAVHLVCTRLTTTVAKRDTLGGWQSMMPQPELTEMLRRTAQDFDDIASDLETGAVEVRHPELMPQNTRAR